jgi:hypothetical protein
MEARILTSFRAFSLSFTERGSRLTYKNYKLIVKQHQYYLFRLNSPNHPKPEQSYDASFQTGAMNSFNVLDVLVRLVTAQRLNSTEESWARVLQTWKSVESFFIEVARLDEFSLGMRVLIK